MQRIGGNLSGSPGCLGGWELATAERGDRWKDNRAADTLGLLD